MKRRPQDATGSDLISFGVELETMIPANCGIEVGHYHSGIQVRTAIAHGGEAMLPFHAPTFGRAPWRAERDGSIHPKDGFKACEFVSPVLFGKIGVERLREFVKFANGIGADVNSSCGCHITIGLKSVLGTCEPEAVAVYLRKLIRVVKQHAWAVYAQTGTSRHVSAYCTEIPAEAGDWTNDLVREIVEPGDPDRRDEAFVKSQKGLSVAQKCRRGMLNLLKAFPAPAHRDTACVEFRAFAGTLNEHKILHHLATCLGLVRKAQVVQSPPRPFARKVQHADAPTALRAMWNDLGWLEDGPGMDCALGQFGPLYSEFTKYAPTALRMAEKFEAKHPVARL